MSEKQSNKERIKEITAGIEKGIMELFESDRYRNYLTIPVGPIAGDENYLSGFNTLNREPLQSIRPAFFSLLISADIALRSTPR